MFQFTLKGEWRFWEGSYRFKLWGPAAKLIGDGVFFWGKMFWNHIEGVVEWHCEIIKCHWLHTKKWLILCDLRISTKRSNSQICLHPITLSQLVASCSLTTSDLRLREGEEMHISGFWTCFYKEDMCMTLLRFREVPWASLKWLILGRTWSSCLV